MDKLHKARDGKAVAKLLKGKETVDLDARDQRGDGAIHAFAREGKFECLMSLLVHGNGDVIDSLTQDKDKMTALHLAVKNKEIDLMRALLAFGAKVNPVNAFRQTPLDIALTLRYEGTEMVSQLVSLGALVSDREQELETYRHESLCRPKSAMPRRLKDYGASALRVDLYSHSATRSKHPVDPSSMSDAELAAVMQLREFNTDVITGCTPPVQQTIRGERVLCLDGGGIRGLVVLEVLMEMERLNFGLRISEQFDWIVGTSIGGVIALLLVYTKRSVSEMRALCFQLREMVFRSGSLADVTNSLEAVLKNYLTEDMRMSAVKYPRVMVTAVDATDSNLSLKFFNNCFHDEYSDELIWKVARYTSASPANFEPKDGYVDGGVRANNPSEYALTRIQKHLKDYARPGEVPRKVGCLVSVGCGTYPPKKLRAFQPQRYFISKKLFVPLHPMKFCRELKELVDLLKTALTESESVADNCRSRCQYQNILYYRFSPELDEQIAVDETDDRKICQMILTAKTMQHSYVAQFNQLHLCCLRFTRHAT